jgi:photosystem II stability/assembly factor-like uncharacterized protein/DNA-binding beta-propeller fold protein YncE
MASLSPPRSRALIVVLGWLALAAFMVHGEFPAEAATRHRHQHAPGALVNAVDFVDARHGWMAGANGAILATSNAGLTWMFEEARTSRDVTSLDFVDRTHGWAIAGSRVLSTVDGGSRWHRHRAPGSGLSSVDFVDPTNGWGIGTEGSGAGGPAPLYRTTDGGRTWGSRGRRFDDVCRVDVANGWAIRARLVFRTSDEGRTWSRPTRLPEVIGRRWIGSIECDDAAIWVLLRGVGGASNQGPAVALRSLDAGSTWRPVLTEGYFPSLPQRMATKLPGQITGYAGVFAATGESAFFTVSCAACDRSTSVSVTHDVGASFASRAFSIGPPQRTSPVAISFSDATDGWLAVQQERGNNEQSDLLHTTDGGRTWRAIYPSYRVPPPVPGAMVGSIVVQRSVDRLMSAAGSIWATSYHALLRIDPATNTVTDRVPITVDRAAAGGGSIWVTSRRGVARISATSAHITARYLGASKYRRTIAVGDGAAWVIPSVGRRLIRIDARTGAVAHLPGFPTDEITDTVAGSGSLWGWSFASVRLYRIDLSTGRVADRKSIELGSRDASLAIRGGVLWAVGSGGTLLKLDAATGRSLASFTLPDLDPMGGYTVAPGARAVWVLANSLDDQRVMKVDADTGRIIRWEFTSGQDLAIADRSRWITADGAVVRLR